MDQKSIGRRIKIARERKRLTQEQLAELPSTRFCGKCRKKNEILRMN